MENDKIEISEVQWFIYCSLYQTKFRDFIVVYSKYSAQFHLYLLQFCISAAAWFYGSCNAAHLNVFGSMRFSTAECLNVSGCMWCCTFKFFCSFKCLCIIVFCTLRFWFVHDSVSCTIGSCTIFLFVHDCLDWF